MSANVSSNQSWWDSEMANELRSLFYQQYGSQKSALNFLGAQMKATINNPQGYSPAALAAARTQATDTTSRQFADAQQGLNARMLATGGSDLPSGVDAQLEGGLQAQRAAQQSTEQNQITLANEDQRQQNYWKAVGGLDTVAQQRDPGAYIADSLNASAGVGALADSATKANNSGFGAELEGSVASGLGSALTGGNSGKGSSTGIGGFFGF